MFLLLMFVAFCFAEPLVLKKKTSGPADDICIGCICEGASLCNTTMGCDGDTCGLFKITWAFWYDAGRHVLDFDDPSAPDAWVRCVKDPYCAAQTVQQYMSRFKQDCNRDGTIDCVDFASIHQLGGFGCSSGNPWNPQFKDRFDTCLKATKKLNR